MDHGHWILYTKSNGTLSLTFYVCNYKTHVILSESSASQKTLLAHVMSRNDYFKASHQMSVAIVIDTCLIS